MFGPTWIGDFRQEPEALYLLQYPGLAFEFPLPQDLFEALAAKGEHPMDLEGRAPLTASRLWVFASDASFETPISVVPDLVEAVSVHPGLGVKMSGKRLRFGAMPQDVFSDFGPPQQVCVKDMIQPPLDAFRIHSRTPLRPASLDYYYNYFYLGMDVLFDGQTHLVQKIVLHTNLPTHERFSRYTRCFFQLQIEESPLQLVGVEGTAMSSDDHEPEGKRSFAGVCIDVRWLWPDIEEALQNAGFSKSRPLVMNQSDDSHTSFGSRYFYAFPGIIFEVMQNGYLASLTMFQVPTSELPSIFHGWS